MGKFFINCVDAHVLSTRNQYKDLNAKELFRYKLHHSHCPQCRKIDKRNMLFTSKLSYIGGRRLSAAQKQSIKECLLKAMCR